VRKSARIFDHLGHTDWRRADCFGLVLTGIYVRRANGEFDDLNNAILKEAQQ
jgi:uncharacterized protein YjbI with pentapeptide repeats